MNPVFAQPPILDEQLRAGSTLRPLRGGVLLATDFPPLEGGISNYLFNIYRQFDLRWMTVVAPQHPQAAQFDSRQQYFARRFAVAPNVPGIRGAWQLCRMRQEAEKLASGRNDVVLHCGHVNAAIAARSVKRRHGTPYLVWTYALEVMDEWLRSKILPALLDADLVITISDFTRDFLLRAGVAAERIVKIRPGTDPLRFRPGMDSAPLAYRLGVAGRPTLLTVSRIVKANRYKGHDFVLRALPRVVREVPELMYLIVGEGDDLPYLRRLADECGVSRNVVFAGRVSDAELPLLYNLCDVFIMCSREERTRRGLLAEGFGISFAEASACAKPVIAGRSGGVGDAVLHDVTGLLVDPTDAEQTAAAILRLLREREVAAKLGQNGRLWVRSELSWERAGHEFQAAMERFFPGEFSWMGAS